MLDYTPQNSFLDNNGIFPKQLYVQNKTEPKKKKEKSNSLVFNLVWIKIKSVHSECLLPCGIVVVEEQGYQQTTVF